MNSSTEITRRRTFAIISHPDAGKTTLTEKFLLDGFLDHASPPLPRTTQTGVIVRPDAPFFSGQVFKIQANMDPRHRDRVAFVRVCSGRFQRDMAVIHQRTGRPLRLSSIDVRPGPGVVFAIDDEQRPVALFESEWSLRYFRERYPEVELCDTPSPARQEGAGAA